jgi:hypothetical protein
MPKGKAIKSPKQYGMMAAIAHGAMPRNMHGPSPEVAEKLLHETSPNRRSSFAKAIAKHSKKK